MQIFARLAVKLKKDDKKTQVQSCIVGTYRKIIRY